MRTFVRIVNRQNSTGHTSYTDEVKAKHYVCRGFAEVVSCTEKGRITEIRMLEPAEIAMLRTAMRDSGAFDPVRGSFEWIVTDSGGGKFVRQYVGSALGTRGFHAVHCK